MHVFKKRLSSHKGNTTGSRLSRVGVGIRQWNISWPWTRRYSEFPDPITWPNTVTPRKTSVVSTAEEITDTGSHVSGFPQGRYLDSRLFSLAGSSGGLRWDPLFRCSTRPCCCCRRRRGKAQDGGQNARRISEGQFKGNFWQNFVSQRIYHCRLGPTDASGLWEAFGIGVCFLVATVGPGAAAPWCAGWEAWYLPLFPAWIQLETGVPRGWWRECFGPRLALEWNQKFRLRSEVVKTLSCISASCALRPPDSAWERGGNRFPVLKCCFFSVLDLTHFRPPSVSLQGINNL